MRHITKFFLSLNTAFGIFITLIAIAAWGSLSLAGNLAFFSGIDDIPLFRWLLEAKNIPGTWWIYIMIILFSLLAVSTIFCAAEALMNRVGRRNLVLSLSPQLIHAGALFIMLGHLLTASSGFSMDIQMRRGATSNVTSTTSITLDDVKSRTDKNGYETDWEAELSFHEEGGNLRKGTLRPSHPLFFGNFSIHIQAVALEPEPSALIRVCRNPGVMPALAGGLLLACGGLLLIWATRSR